MTPAERAERIRLRDDFKYWAARAYKILPKEGDDLIPLVLNAAQEHALAAIERQRLAGKPIRLIILKGRQQGLSTLIEAWQLWRTTQGRAKKSLVLAHEADSASGLFQQAKRGYDNLPAILKPSIERSNKKELTFGVLDSALEVTTAGGRGIGRGKTFRYCHASEVAFWPPNSAEGNWNGLLQTVPTTADSAIFVESTANGMGGLFHRIWNEASLGLTEFDTVFIPWFWQPEYRLPAPEDFKRTPVEDEIAAKFGLDNDQLLWRRRRIAASSLDLFNQEYPNTPEDAFLTSGRPVFEPGIIHRLKADSPEPLMLMALEDRLAPDGKSTETSWEEHSRGELTIYKLPDPDKPAEVFYIGADVAEGIRGGDFSVAQVLNGSREQVAVWRGHIYPDAFADVLFHLGSLYNDATIAVELNNHGILTANRLAKDLGYPEVWLDRVYDKITDRETIRLGFTQTIQTRPLIINKLRADVRDGTITIRDRETLNEMQHFVVTEAGRMEAQDGSHDDHVMSLAIANHINEGEWTPITNKDSYYAEVD